jgi:hypothetical protein
MRKRSSNLTSRTYLTVILPLFGVLASLSCGKSDDGLTTRLLDANSKVLACEKELAETKAARDSLKRQLALALASPSKIQLTDPEIIELVASVRKERSGGAGPEGIDLNPKEASTIVMNGAPALQACYERALKRNAALQMRAGLGVVLGITVKPVGEVDTVDVSPSVDTEMTKCMKSTISRWKFPKFTGNAVTIEQKLTLTPKT